MKVFKLKTVPLILVLLSLGYCTPAKDTPRLLIMVKRNYATPSTEKAKLVVDWKEIAKRLPALKAPNLVVIDQHFGRPVEIQLTDSNGDGTPDQVVMDITFASNEPVYTFGILSSDQSVPITSGSIAVDPRFEIKFLVPYKEGAQPGLGAKIVESTIHTYPDPKSLSIISPGKWTYEYGFFLNGTYKLWSATKKDEYLNYARQWVDNFIDESGQFKPDVYHQEEYRLDDIQPGRLCIWLYEQTDQEKYKKVADQLLYQLAKQPKTSEGGYWHKEIYPNQMWLDGIFMGDVFSMQYASTFKQPQWFDEAILQIKLMYKHAADPKTGLLYHGWDESKNKVWADQVKGTSPEFWTRAIGWYAMALIECLDYLPKNHPDRKNIEEIFQKVCASIKNYQDPNTGLWFQVINKGNLPDNWIETSGSAMFVYAFAKGANTGLLDKKFLVSAEKGYASILKNYLFADDSGDVHLDQAVKVGSLNMKNSKGDYPYYVSCERRIDDYKGLAALLFASMELKK